LEFIALDSQSTIRKVIDSVLSCEIDTHRLKVEMELNSIEAIKMQFNQVGAAFVSTSAISKELQMRASLCTYRGVVVKRTCADFQPQSLPLEGSRSL